MAVSAPVFNLVDGGVDPQSFRHRFRRGREKGNRRAGPFRGAAAAASHIPIVDEAGHVKGGLGDAGDADYIGRAFRFGESEFLEVVDRTVVGRRMIMVARQSPMVMVFGVGQWLGAIESHHRPHNEWNDNRCHLAVC